MKIIKKQILVFIIIGLLCGCVNQHPDKTEKPPMEVEKPERIIATSPAVADILKELGVNLIAAADSKNQSYLESYSDTAKVGFAMTPDMEKIKSLQPDYVFSPVSLVADLLPKYENIGIPYGFLNLSNVEGMYLSIKDLGKLLDREEKAEQMLYQYQNELKKYREKYRSQKSPTVLILMGLPGSYVIATENSYVGNLVEIAGGKNVYAGSDKQFLTVNTEDMLKKEPDIILRTAHALPQEVQEMFAKEFTKNEIWQHFKAVQTNRVYDLNNELFGMSANLRYSEALNRLGEIFYGN